jgi:hypothetical protein
MTAVAPFLMPLIDLTERPPSIEIFGRRIELPGSISDMIRGTQETQVLSGYIPRTQNSCTWCWAAAAVSIVEYSCRKAKLGGTTLTQCDVVTAYYGIDCCGRSRDDDPFSPNYAPDCRMKLGWLEDMLKLFGCAQAQGIRDEPNGQLRFDEVITEIKEKKQPIGCKISLAGRGNHYVVIVGYTAGSGGTQMVHLHNPLRDPANGLEVVTFDNLKSNLWDDGDRWVASILTSEMSLDKKKTYCEVPSV